MLLRRNPGPIQRGKPIADLTLPSVPAGVPSELLTRRPALLQAEETLIAANAQIGAARALYFPAISLTGAFGGASAQLSNLFSGPARAWNYTGQVVGPIFTFAVTARVAEAGGAAAALYNYQYSIRAFFDVDNALVATITQSSRLRNGWSRRSGLRASRLQYDGGYTAIPPYCRRNSRSFPPARARVGACFGLRLAANTYRQWAALGHHGGRPQPAVRKPSTSDQKQPIF